MISGNTVYVDLKWSVVVGGGGGESCLVVDKKREIRLAAVRLAV
jgi:hypothetical protein